MGSESDHDHGSSQIVIKGKRTKRQRSSSSSPIGLTATDSSSSDYSGGDDGYYFPTTSGEIYESTEEEEDMANCLIMLAQGDRRPKKIIQDDFNGDKVQKLKSSRKFSTMIISNDENNKTGFYVYECKTCNRCFPSFQALGGHRASHKKPKAATLEAEKKPSTSSSSVVAVVPIKDDLNSDSPLHLHQKGNKIHECSICGSVFSSGQALGGHMRRHRAAAAPNTNNSNENQVTTMKPSNIGDVKPAAAVAATTRGILPLDLNLPAPEDDHQFRSSLVFSAPALVDCHY